MRVLTHQEVTHQAEYYYNLRSPKKLQGEFEAYRQAGAYFPDWGYACGKNSENSELAHWPEFWEASVTYLRKKYPANDVRAKRLTSFLFGVVSHGIMDANWHSLNMEQGFIHAMQYINYNYDYDSAHIDADIGGDLFLSRFGKLSYISDYWAVPTEDLIEIYSMLGQKVTKRTLNMCMKMGFALQQAAQRVGRHFFPKIAQNSEFLTQNYFSYFRGGVQETAILTANCWEKLDGWISTGNYSQCEGMGSYYNIKHQKIQKLTLTKRLIDCVTKYPDLVQTTDISILAIRDSLVSTIRCEYCIRNYLHISDSKEFPIIQKGILGTINHTIFALYDYISGIFKKKCLKVKGTELHSSTEYSSLGKSIATGDFNGDGIIDIAIGAPNLSIKDAFHIGGVYLIYGPLKFDVGTYQIESLAKFVVGDKIEGSGFGSQIVVVDLNRDGQVDLVISAPGHGRNNYKGKVYVYFGSKNKLEKAQDWDISIEFTHQEYPDSPGIFGTVLKSLDLDGDGYLDLLIGTPEFSLDSNRKQIGMVNAFLSTTGHTGKVGSRDADWTLYGSNEFENFGKSMELMNDTLFIGSPYLRDRNIVLGGVYKYFIEQGHPKYHSKILGHGPNSQFGFSMTSMGKNTSLLAIGSPSMRTTDYVRTASDLPGILVKSNNLGFQAGAVSFFDTLSNSISVKGGSISIGNFGNNVKAWKEKLFISEPSILHGSGKIYSFLSYQNLNLSAQNSFLQCYQGQPNARFGENFDIIESSNSTLYLIASSTNDNDKNSWSRGLLGGKISLIQLAG